MRPLDYFNDFHKPHMAAGDRMWGGMAVVISPNVPQFHAGDELVPVWPWWAPIYRFFFSCEPTPRRFRAGKPIMEEQAFQMSGKLFVSPKMWDQMKRSTQCTE